MIEKVLPNLKIYYENDQKENINILNLFKTLLKCDVIYQNEIFIKEILDFLSSLLSCNNLPV